MTHDADNDGKLDLYVVTYGQANSLFHNEGRGVFTDATRGPEADAEAAHAIAWGDYDRDGWIDLYVSNMFSAAGNRIMFQQQFKPGAAGEVKSRLQRFARGNSLFRNLGTPAAPAFRDTSIESAVTMGRWAWSSNFVDINNGGLIT